MFRPALNREISPSEIQAMIDSGMSRKEVCQALDISYPTLRKYIGSAYPRPDRMKNAERTARTVAEKPAVSTPAAGTPAVSTPAAGTPAVSTPAINTSTVTAPAISTPYPTLAERLQMEVEAGKRAAPKSRRFPNRTVTHTVAINGEYARYEIDVIKKTVTLTTTIFCGVPLATDELDAVIEELRAIRAEMTIA